MDLKRFFNKLNEETGRTSFNGAHRHAHTYNVDKKGNGQTTRTVGNSPDHVHQIENNEVKPAGDDKHTHTIY